MCDMCIEPAISKIKPISHIWYQLLKEHHIPVDGTLVEVAPGYETKIGDALALLKFRGTIILIEPDQKAADHIQQAYKQIMPQAIVTVIVKCLQDIHAGMDVPFTIDALVANHPFDDMVIACATHKQQPFFFSQERKEEIYVSSSTQEIYDAISDRDYIRGILTTIAIWKQAIQQLKPNCVMVSQYPSRKLIMKGLAKRHHSGSIIIEVLKNFYENYLKDQYKEKSFSNQQGNPLWWMIAREPYADLIRDLAEQPRAIKRLGKPIFVPQQARCLDPCEYDVVYTDRLYAAHSPYGAEMIKEISHFAIILDNNNMPSPQTFTVFADRQKDATQISLGGNSGSGRAVYYGARYNILGVGKTSLCTSSLPSHSTGTIDLVGALRRVVLSKWINHVTKRAVAHPIVIARKQTAQFKWNPNPMPLALLVRVDEGTLDRPSHVEYLPEIAIDFDRMVIEYAQLDAEYFAYRFMLGAWSTGNHSLSGHIIDLETASFVKYRGPYATASSKYKENLFGYEGLGFIRILKQLAGVKGIQNEDIEKRFYAQRREYLAHCFLSLLGIDETKSAICFSRYYDQIVTLSDQFEQLAKKICPEKVDLNLYKPISEHKDPSLLDMTNLFRNLEKIFISGRNREKKALRYLIRKDALEKVKSGITYEPNVMPDGQPYQSEIYIKQQAIITYDQLEGFLDSTKYFVHALFQFLDTLNGEKLLPQQSYWKDRLSVVNQDFLPMHELNTKLIYWVEEYRSNRIDPETLNAEIEKLCQLPHYPTGENFYLEHVPLLNYLNLDKRELQNLSPYVATIDLQEGEKIIRAGECEDSLYVLMQGSCKIMADAKECGSIGNRGALIEKAMMNADEKNTIANIVTQTPVRVLQIYKEGLQAIMNARPVCKKLLTNIAIQNKTGAVDKIIDLAIFKGINPEDIRLFLADKASEKKFSKGRQLIVQGEYNSGIYFLISGSVVLSQSKTHSEIGSIELVDTPLIEGIFGERSILFDQGAICTVTASEDVQTLFVHKDDFKKLFDLHPQLLCNCLDHISDYSQSNESRSALISTFQKKLSDHMPHLSSS